MYEILDKRAACKNPSLFVELLCDTIRFIVKPVATRTHPSLLCETAETFFQTLTVTLETTNTHTRTPPSFDASVQSVLY